MRITASTLLLALVGGFVLTGCGDGPWQGARGPDARTLAWRSDVQPVLADYCTGCHGGAEPSGSLDLEPWALDPEAPTLATLRERAGLVERLAEHVRGGLMPPPGEFHPSDAARETFAAWWTAQLAAAWDAAPPDPGRVTMRRLNRYEYRRTVEALVGVDFDADAFFPSDDVGYGFDHIGDVLSMPPILFEKYLAAGERIAAEAMPLCDPYTPQRFEAERLPNTTGSPPLGGEAVLNSNGQISASVGIACEGRYVVRVRARGQHVPPDPIRMQVRLDGVLLHEHAIRADNTAATTYTCQAQLSEGTHDLAAAFVNDAYQPNHPDPRMKDRNLRVDWLEIQGPTAADAAALLPAPGEERSCAEGYLARLLRRAFRRPPTPVEIERHVGLVMQAMAAGESFRGALQVALQAVLVSPHFLFRVELDERSGPGTHATPLGDHQLASRLAYFLWSRPPDEALDAVADAGALRTRLHEEVTRMLEHPGAAALVKNFAVQWLELRRLDTATPAPTLFASFDEPLRASMRAETEHVVAALIREDRSILELLDWPFTYVDRRLAEHYGIAGVSGEGFRRVKLADPNRGGLLGHASILTLTSYPTRTSPVQRGKWLMDEVLGTPPAPPPPGVGTLEAQEPALLKLTLRERLQKHREDPTCAVCHDRMDNLGYGLEVFDPVGRTRPAGVEADSAGTLPDGRTFSGPRELRAILKADPGFPRCFAEKLLTYALGRGLEPYDRPTVLRIVEEARAHDFRFSSFVHAIVGTDAFTMRRTAGAPR